MTYSVSYHKINSMLNIEYICFLFDAKIFTKYLSLIVNVYKLQCTIYNLQYIIQSTKFIKRKQIHSEKINALKTERERFCGLITRSTFQVWYSCVFGVCVYSLYYVFAGNCEWYNEFFIQINQLTIKLFSSLLP